jgi:hypothetical protein
VQGQGRFFSADKGDHPLAGIRGGLFDIRLHVAKKKSAEITPKYD